MTKSPHDIMAEAERNQVRNAAHGFPPFRPPYITPAQFEYMKRLMREDVRRVGLDLKDFPTLREGT